MRILITGSRDWTDTPTIAAAIGRAVRSARADKADTVIVHGDCRTGADAIADALARSWGVEVEKHPADWHGQGIAAGPLRNKRMIKEGADICLAFIKNNSKGATGCAKFAQAAGIPTEIYRE